MHQSINPNISRFTLFLAFGLTCLIKVLYSSWKLYETLWKSIITSALSVMRSIMSLWSMRDNSSTSSIWPWLGSFGLWARENITHIHTSLTCPKHHTQAQRLDFIPVLRQCFLAIGRGYVRGVVLKPIITWRGVLKN